jgi:hypothetical protein
MTQGEGTGSALIGMAAAAGVAQVVAGVAMYLAGVYFAPWSMVVSLVVLLVCIIVGTRWYRDNRVGGAMTFAQALRVGIAISFATGLIYAVYNVVSISFFYPHFLDDMVQARVAQTHESFAGLRAEASVPGIAIPNLIRLTVFGSVLSLATSWFIKRRG